MAPQKCPSYNPGSCEYVTLRGKEELRLVYGIKAANQLTLK